MLEIRCPACHSNSLKVLTTLDLPINNQRLQTNILACSTCTHRFMPTTQAQHQLIEHRYHNCTAFREDPYFHIKIREAIEKDIKTRVPISADILDVGCGNGAFLAAMKDLGYEAEGVDLSEAAVRYCQNKGLKAQAGNFLTLTFRQKYDLITMWDVVEHLRDPQSYINRAKTLLKKEGILILKIPGFGRRIFYPIKIHSHLAKTLLGAPGHVQYFTSHSLSILLIRCGFHQIEWLGSYNFRSNTPTKSIKRKVSRVFAKYLKIMSDSKNIYVAAKFEK